ncbi:D-cysteine desulfhydrase family protein [Pseudoalteromonas denitrificans]|uniref:D-cysteine desulfhydrase n=1 Tax=Pseudoalteromonas denitrificans DSM 6059 TaxID=1123010 RepID=A0A1I1J0R0_9GAMM|nr:D-cysteine desulfhydrase family protein [Pseudoalteromonas denitrificans]SFC41721.1 D-cysteine desulfhydrase [Pseudoalteromonas denitrificans DSM 6059]
MMTKKFPKEELGFFPTPVVKLSRLSEYLGGPEIFMKRDDMTGLALGGNKTRKLEYILGDAVAQGCDSVITAGAAQSNHCRQTAAAAASLNMECHLVLGGEEPVEAKGNLLLDQIFGSHLHWAGQNRKGEDIPQIYKQLKKSGKKPYVVPYGGSNELGALSFVAAVEELESQIKDEQFTHIVFASSSGGTHAGLMIGKKLYGKGFKLIGINIDKGETDEIPFDHYIIELANKTSNMLGLKYEFTQEALTLNSDYVGQGYGVVGKLEQEAISLTARTEGILLDPVYTGRAMGGLIDMIRTGIINKNDKVLFWHTGGAPAVFAYSDKLHLMPQI